MKTPFGAPEGVHSGGGAGSSHDAEMSFGGHPHPGSSPDPPAAPEPDATPGLDDTWPLRAAGSGLPADLNPDHNPVTEPPKPPESVSSVGGGGGNLREVVGACGGIVVALYCSGVYFVLAFPFFTYVPSSGALGARMLPKARLMHKIQHQLFCLCRLFSPSKRSEWRPSFSTPSDVWTSLMSAA